MEIRLIFFKEIVGVISLKTGLKYQYPKRVRSREEKSPRRFFLPKVSLISILQKFSSISQVDPPRCMERAGVPTDNWNSLNDAGRVE